MSQKLRMAVLGPGKIFGKVMKDLSKCGDAELYAVASRNAEHAKEVCREYGAEKWYGSYKEMLLDPQVDFVYIATPHVFHCEQTLMCLRAGKHVICEKPFAMSEAEAKEMVTCARENRLFLMEAMWTRFMPAMVKLREMKQAGIFGEIKEITGDFSFYSEPDPQWRLYNPSLGGGAMLDVGIYPLSVICMLKGKPKRIRSTSALTDTGVDARTFALLDFPDGAIASLSCGIDVNGSNHLSVCGTKSRLEMDHFWRGNIMTLFCGDKEETISFPKEQDGYYHEFDHVARCIREGRVESPVMPLNESIHLCAIMEKILKENGIVYPAWNRQ